MSHTKNILVKSGEGDNYTEIVKAVNAVEVEGDLIAGYVPTVQADGSVEWEIAGAGSSNWEADGTGFIKPKNDNEVKLEHINGVSAFGATLVDDESAADALITLGAVGTSLVKDPTGFDIPENVTVSYDSTTRKVTLGGSNWKAYYQGVEVAALVPTWESEAHSADAGTYFLYYNGSSFVWGTAVWDFDALHIAVVFNETAKACLRECHGLMPWTAHKEFHEVVGTYLSSGGDIGGITLNSTTAADRRPTISEAFLQDEDLKTTLPVLNDGNYSWLYLTGTDTANITVDNADIISVTTNQPNYNELDGTWGQTAFPVNAYGKIFVMAIPSTADAFCQKRRFVFIQPQTVSTSLEAINGVNPDSVELGDLGAGLPEYSFIGEIVIRYTAGNWELISTRKLVGTKVSQVSAQSGITSVASDATLTGAGTIADPLGVANGTEGQVLRAGSSAPAYANSGNLLNTTITDDADLTAAHFVKGLLIANKATALTLTIQAQADETYIADSVITIANRGAGTLTIQADTGVTINGESAGSVDLTQYQGGALIRLAEDVWMIANYTAEAAGS